MAEAQSRQWWNLQTTWQFQATPWGSLTWGWPGEVDPGEGAWGGGSWEQVSLCAKFLPNAQPRRRMSEGPFPGLPGSGVT